MKSTSLYSQIIKAKIGNKSKAIHGNEKRIIFFEAKSIFKCI